MKGIFPIILSAVSAGVSLLVFVFARVAEGKAAENEKGASKALLQQMNLRLNELVLGMAKQDARIEALMNSLAEDRERIAIAEEKVKTSLQRVNEIARWREAKGM